MIRRPPPIPGPSDTAPWATPERCAIRCAGGQCNDSRWGRWCGSGAETLSLLSAVTAMPVTTVLRHDCQLQHPTVTLAAFGRDRATPRPGPRGRCQRPTTASTTQSRTDRRSRLTCRVRRGVDVSSSASVRTVDSALDRGAHLAPRSSLRSSAASSWRRPWGGFSALRRLRAPGREPQPVVSEELSRTQCTGRVGSGS